MALDDDLRAALSVDDDDNAAFLFVLGIGAFLLWRWYQSNQAGLPFTLSPDAFAYSGDSGGYSGEDSGAGAIWPTNVSAAGAAYIKQQEGYRTKPYPSGSGQAIGWGHQIQPGENFAGGIDQATAERLFQQDIGIAESAVYSALTRPPTQGQFDAMADLAFQEGAGAFRGSTLVQRFNAGDVDGAAQEFNRWTYANGAPNSVIASRRQGDIARFYS